jgi:hypothetical protein
MTEKENGIGLIGIIFIVLIIAWIYNANTKKKIENDYGYSVETKGVTEKPDCSSLEPQNPYDSETGHSAGFEWGESGNECGGNSDSFIEGCEEYQNQENAYKYCLSRNHQ